MSRPRIDIDMRQVRALCEIQCTDEEVAAVLCISADTLIRRKREPAFLAEMEAGRATGRESLRRKQWSVAMLGNPTMLIWLGKQVLGQSDKLEQGIRELPPLIINGPSEI